MKNDRKGKNDTSELQEANSRYLNRTYSDLLGREADAESLRLVTYLEAAFGRAEPPAHLDRVLAQTLREHLHERGRKHTEKGILSSSQSNMNTQYVPRSRLFSSFARPFARLLWLPRQISTAAALLLAVFILVGAGYAALPALERLFGVHTGTGAIITERLGKEVNASRSVDGFTVTVRRVYADPNQIAVGLTVSGPPGRTFNNIMPWGDRYETPPKGTMGESPILTDKEGREFKGGMGGEQGAVENGTAPYLLTYEGTGLERSPKEVDVRLKIGELTAYERRGENSYEDVRVQGPFIFELTIPVEQGRVADLHQTVESGGASVTLERVVTTLTGTRLSLRGAGPNADVRLVVDGVTYRFQQPDGAAIPFRWTADSLWEYVSGTSLQDKQGKWELTVRPAAPIPSDIDPAATRLEGGPWTFKFTVPPAPQADK